MAGNLWGADVAQLRTLAQQLGQTSDRLLQQSAQLGNQINNNPSWKGQDAVQFRSDWNGTHRAVIHQAAVALKQESRKLLEHADQQDQASNAGGAGGAPIPGGAGVSADSSEDKRPFRLGPDWLADSDDSPSPFRGGWDTYNLIKAFPNIRAGVFDVASIVRESGFRQSLTKAAWDTFQESNALSKYFNMSSDLFDGKFHKVLNLAPDSSAFKVLGGFGHALGGVGVGLDSLDAVNKWQRGDELGAYYSGAKAFIGVGSFFPPPVGTVCMVASGALALYDNVKPIKDSVNWAGGKIAEGWNAAGDAIDQGAEAAGDALADAGNAVTDGAKAVSNFFGF